MPSEQALTQDHYQDLLRYGSSKGLPLQAGEIAWTGTGRALHFAGSLFLVGVIAGLFVAAVLAVTYV